MLTKSLLTKSPLTEILCDEIRRDGPIPFRRFMEAALYHPEHGYYRKPRDPFGREGDFYTAEQLQPVFGRLIGARIASLFRELGSTGGLQVVELGAGRGEMGLFLSEYCYLPVDLDRGALPGRSLPEKIRGVVFSNEFFDALPVDRIIFRDTGPRLARVGWSGEQFVWSEGEPAGGELLDYLDEYHSVLPERGSIEVNLEALRWMERISRSLDEGFVLTIDYGYTSAERLRFPEGTLMSYRRHLANEDVLCDPGTRDITAHVCFTALEKHGAKCDLETVRLEPLVRTLLDAGEPDQFAHALEGPDPMARRLQLKTLLVGMGETFRTLLQKKKAPRNSGPYD